MYLWLRIGDCGDYQQFDGIDDAADALNELHAGKPTGWQQFGFTTPNYWGYDYISCYWGDDDAQPERELDESERTELTERLTECFC